MSFRGRLLLALVAATLLPLGLLAVGVRRQITARLTAQYERRGEALARVVRQDLTLESASIAARLATLSRDLSTDNRFRLAVYGVNVERSYLLDYAEHAMRLAGLSALQIQDEAGRIVSSGHFRNEFDRLEPDLPRVLAASGGGASLLRLRAPDGPLLVLARSDSVRVGGRRFTLAAGVAVDDRLLARFGRDGELTVSLLTPDGALASDAAVSGPARRVEAELPLPYIDAWGDDSLRIGPARLVITRSLSELDALRGEVHRLFLLALTATFATALALAVWLSVRLSRPLADLARATSAIDLDRLDVELATDAGRDDEIGVLARRFGVMTRRLRASAARLRDAERRATVGEMARQVNHDVKNGLIPIRNVLRHLAEVQQRCPGELPRVFGERRATLESSLSYLDTLARNYARLAPRAELRPIDIDALVREAALTASAGRAVEIRTRLAGALPPVLGDPVALRRILDNLIANAVESLGASAESDRASAEGVTLATEHAGDGVVRLVVEDTGRGMTGEELARCFDDFFTTKRDGTGLGLSVVRRLVADLQGSLRVQSEPAHGTTFTIELPAAVEASHR